MCVAGVKGDVPAYRCLLTADHVMELFSSSNTKAWATLPISSRMCVIQIEIISISLQMSFEKP